MFFVGVIAAVILCLLMLRSRVVGWRVRVITRRRDVRGLRGWWLCMSIRKYIISSGESGHWLRLHNLI